jgi:hypothetical protein
VDVTGVDNVTASASYFLAAIGAASDRELAEDTYRAIADLLPHHLRDALDDAWEAVA